MVRFLVFKSAKRFSCLDWYQMVENLGLAHRLIVIVLHIAAWNVPEIHRKVPDDIFKHTWNKPMKRVQREHGHDGEISY